MGPKSLVDLASAVCIKNIKGLESVGDYLPYESVRHILFKIETAYQLRQIELNSPQIQNSTGEIWLRLIERDFPLEYKAKGYKPQNQSKWYRVWEKYKKDHDRSLQESEEKLRNALAGLQENKEKNVSKIVEGKHLPRMPKAKRRVPKDHTTGVLTFGGGSRTKTVNGASVMRKVRREVKEIRNIQGSLSQSIRPPNARPPQQQARISKAPPSMVDEKRIAAQPAYRPPPKEPSPPPASALEEFQERAAYITDSDSESDDEENDEASPPPPARPAKLERKVSPPRATAKAPVKPVTRPSGSMMQRKFGGRAGGSTISPIKSQTHSIRTIPGSNSSTSPTKRPSDTTTKPPLKPEPGKTSQPPSPTKLAKPPTQYLPRSQTSPPPHSPPERTSPPPQAVSSSASPATAAPAPNPPRKRKAVDIFMRPKKR